MDCFCIMPSACLRSPLQYITFTHVKTTLGKSKLQLLDEPLEFSVEFSRDIFGLPS